MRQMPLPNDARQSPGQSNAGGVKILPYCWQLGLPDFWQ
jgi:hypothetical protein